MSSYTQYISLTLVMSLLFNAGKYFLYISIQLEKF